MWMTDTIYLLHLLGFLLISLYFPVKEQVYARNNSKNVGYL